MQTTKVSMFSFEKRRGKMLLGILLDYKPIYKQNQYPYILPIDVYLHKQTK